MVMMMMAMMNDDGNDDNDSGNDDNGIDDDYDDDDVYGRGGIFTPCEELGGINLGGPHDTSTPFARILPHKANKNLISFVANPEREH